MFFFLSSPFVSTPGGAFYDFLIETRARLNIFRENVSFRAAINSLANRARQVASFSSVSFSRSLRRTTLLRGRLFRRQVFPEFQRRGSFRRDASVDRSFPIERFLSERSLSRSHCVIRRIQRRKLLKAFKSSMKRLESFLEKEREREREVGTRYLETRKDRNLEI